MSLQGSKRTAALDAFKMGGYAPPVRHLESKPYELGTDSGYSVPTEPACASPRV